MYKILFVFLFLSTAKISAQVTVINTGTSEHLRTIHKAGHSSVVSGIGNYLVKCHGECNTLIPLNIPYTTPYPYFYFNLSRPDSNTLYMTAIENLHFMIFKSGDCGINWSKKFDTMYFPDPLQTVFFDSLNGMAFCTYFKTLKTANGFNTFSLGTWPSNDPGFSVSYGDSSLTLTSGMGVGMSISHNRGTSWSSCSGFYLPIFDVKFYNKDTLFAITSSSGPPHDSCFIVSYNKGLTWRCKKFTPNDPIMNPANYTLRRLCVISFNEIYALAHDNQANRAVIFKTLDQGQTWLKYTLPFSAPLNDMAFINDSVALVCGNSGLLFKWNKIQAAYTSIAETSSENTIFSVFPNPVKDELSITTHASASQSNYITLTLSDFSGKLLQNVNLDAKRNVHKLDLKGFSCGMYFLSTVIEGRTFSYKVIKE